jgi:bifunctional non-homologous end joining protein LigD
MLASLAEAPLKDAQLVYEPKYDGIRAIVEIGGRVSVRGTGQRTETRPRPPRVRLWSRLGNEKTHQFPEIVRALEQWAARRKEPLVLDGEIVALDAKGEPAGFQQLQGRIHLAGEHGGPAGRTAFIAFDLLRDGAQDLRGRPLLERRAALERIVGRATSPLLRISEMVRGDGRALYQRALDNGWEGLIAKDAASLYKSGKRTPDWRKLKIVHEQEFVIGGWTEPRESRAYFGALLLGVYAPEPRIPNSKSLVYVGHTGTGFNEAELRRVMKRLEPIETATCPFQPRPKTNERPHWVEPSLVAQIKFTEWTADAKLRHPVYLGLRDDKKPEDVRREPQTRLHETSNRGAAAGAPSRAAHSDTVVGNRTIVEQLRALEDARKDGVLDLPNGGRLSVSNLHKIFWPTQKLTKGDLLRYYAQAAPFILPAVADRPLVMKRFPNGVAGAPFYQHRAPNVPDGVRVETVGAAERRPQIIGGELKALLYMTQIAAISQDPWFSRVGTPQFADHVALDLDPAEGLPFSQVLEVARWIHDELDTLGAAGFAKTSGADGLHIYIPLPPKTSYEAGLIFCQIVATVVAHKHPKAATVERAVRVRGARVYIDYLQNILGKTLATAYSARASAYAGVSTPLTWQEVDEGVRREDFTIRTAPERFARVGDLWGALRETKGADLSRVSRYAEAGGKRRSKRRTS